MLVFSEFTSRVNKGEKTTTQGVPPKDIFVKERNG